VTPRATLVLGGLVVIVALYIFAVDRPQAQRAEEASHLVHLQKAAITAFTVTTAKGAVALSRTDGAHWQITQPIQTPAASLAVSDLLDAAIGIVPQRTLSGTGDLAAYGLSQPAVRAAFQASGGRTATLELGKATPVGNALFARLDPGTSVYVIDSGVRDALTKTAADLRQKTLADFANADVQQLRITSPRESLVVNRTGPDRWRIDGPRPWPADDFKVTDLFFPLTTADGKVFHDGVTDLAGYGLDHPDVTMELTMKGRREPLRLLFAKGPKVTYAMIGGSRTVLELDADLEGRMTPAPISLVSTHVLPYNPQDLTAFKWIRNGKTLEIRRQGPGFTGGSLTDEDVSNMFSSVNLMDADRVQPLTGSFTTAPAFEVQTDGGADARFLVQFYPRPKGWTAVNRALGLEYTIASAALDSFPQPIKVFLGVQPPPAAPAGHPGSTVTPSHAPPSVTPSAPAKR